MTHIGSFKVDISTVYQQPGMLTQCKGMLNKYQFIIIKCC